MDEHSSNGAARAGDSFRRHAIVCLRLSRAAVPKLAPRGLIVIDNTLWSGNVLDPAPDDENGKALAALNDRIVNDDRVVTVQLPIRDGVTLVRRA